MLVLVLVVVVVVVVVVWRECVGGGVCKGWKGGTESTTTIVLTPSYGYVGGCCGHG